MQDNSYYYYIIYSSNNVTQRYIIHQICCSYIKGKKWIGSLNGFTVKMEKYIKAKLP